MAIKDFSKAIDLKPILSKPTTIAALLTTINREFDLAIVDYTKAISNSDLIIKPYYANAYYNRGLAYKKKGS